MKYFWNILHTNPLVTFQILLASFLVNLLGMASSLYAMTVYGRYLTHGITATLYTLTGGLLIALVMEYGFRKIRYRLAESVVLKPERELGELVFHRMNNARTLALAQMPADLRGAIPRHLEFSQQAFNANNLLVILDVPFALLFVFAVFLLNPLLGLVTFLIVGGALIVTLLGGANQAQLVQHSMNSGQKQNVLWSASNDSDTVRAFNAAPYLLGQWQNRSGLHRYIRHAMSMSQQFFMNVGQFSAGLLTVGVTGLGASQVVQGHLDIATLIGVNILAARGLMSITRLATIYSTLAQGKESRHILQQILQLPQELEQGTAIKNFSGRLEFKDVAFRFPGGSGPLFESLELLVEPGQVLVVTGGNGTGKTTLARLLVGVLQPIRGSILADGVDVRQFFPQWWRQQLLYLPQEPFFIEGTLEENLRLFNPNLEDVAIKQLLERAGLKEFIDQHPKGIKQELP
ncbi:MAG: ATP-binding cassette domain-containing protein, partial [Magnetococcales bacterium]|nr:ATP-binding cassette domain-containing protein [Magnetococcales bacterium]